MFTGKLHNLTCKVTAHHESCSGVLRRSFSHGRTVSNLHRQLSRLLPAFTMIYNMCELFKGLWFQRHELVSEPYISACLNKTRPFGCILSCTHVLIATSATSSMYFQKHLLQSHIISYGLYTALH